MRFQALESAQNFIAFNHPPQSGIQNCEVSFKSPVQMTSETQSPRPVIPRSIRHYELTGTLGHGAFSTVVKALNKLDNKMYACKVMAKTVIEGERDKIMFQREIDAMAFMRHPSLVALRDFFWDERNYYMIMDLCNGGELFDYIVQHDRLDEASAAYLFKQIVQAVKYCHQLGVAHRDLKPENILIQKFPIVKLTDFGLCGFMNGHRLLQTFCGSPCYCSPECLQRVDYDGRKSDVWSLGVILFAMVTGEHPWNILNMSIMLRQILTASFTFPGYVSPLCRDLINSMLVVDPNERATIERVEAHSWLKLSSKAPYPPLKQNLPQVEPGMTLYELAEKLKEHSENEDPATGILSPFSSEVSEEKEEERMALTKSFGSLPHLLVKMPVGGPNAPTKRHVAQARKMARKFGHGRIGLAQWRQASENSFQKVRLPPLTSQTPPPMLDSIPKCE